MVEQTPLGVLPSLNHQMPLRKKLWFLELRNLDLFLFGVLSAFVLLFQLQTVAEWITTLRIREALYGYLYLRVILGYKLRFNQVFLLVIFFLAYAALLFIHTYLVYGTLMAVQGFMRYVSAALLAPLAAVFFTSWRQVYSFIIIWLLVIVSGAATLIYQIGGGNLSDIFHGYVVSRAALPRHMTILGEPNVGGMVSSLVVVMAVLAIKPLFFKVVLLLIAAILMIYSLSKAALLGLAVAVMLIILFRYRQIIITKQKLIIIFAVILLIAFSFVLDMHFGFLGNITDYLQVVLKTSLNFDRTGESIEGPGILSDIWYRVFQKTADGVELVLAQRNLHGLLLIGGSGYGISGSAAVLIFGDKAIAPHNTFLEIFLVGGLLQLFIFLLILFYTYLSLRKVSGFGMLQLSLFTCFLVLVLLMAGYPVFYQPVLGYVLWLLVGVAANGVLMGQRKDLQKKHCSSDCSSAGGL